jgi:hypothetical protein
MKSFSHPNSSVDAPLLSPDQDALYLHMTAGGPLPNPNPRRDYLAQDLRALAERLDCDRAAFRLASLGVNCAAGYWQDRRTERAHVVAACVCLTDAADHVHVIDAQAANRLADRLSSGLQLADALSRTLEQCDRPTYTEEQLKRLEHSADVYERALDHGLTTEAAHARAQKVFAL